MKRNSKVFLIAIGCIFAGGVFWWCMDAEGIKTNEVVIQKGKRDNQPSNSLKINDKKPLAKPWKDRPVFQRMIGTPPHFSASQIDAFTKKFKDERNASMLAVLYSISGSAAVKGEVMASPVDPFTGLVMAIGEEDKNERKAWLTDIDSAYPNGAGATILRAQLLYSEGRSDEAQALVAKISELNFDDIRELVSKETSLWKEAGERPEEAGSLAREGRLSSMILDSFEDIVLRGKMSESNGAGVSTRNANLNQWIESLRTGLEADKSLYLTRRFSDIQGLDNSLQNSEEGHQIRPQELDKIEISVRESLSKADPGTVDEYYNHLEKEGLAKAVLWLTGHTVNLEK